LLALSSGKSVGGEGIVTGALGGAGILGSAVTGSGAVTAQVLAGRLLQAALAGSGTLNTPTLAAIGNLAADIVIGAAPNADDIAQAVWGTPYAGFTSAGTFGFALKFLFFSAHHKVITNPAAGTYDVYGDDDVTVIYTGDLWQDAAGTNPYSGNGAERRDRLNP